MSKTIETEAYWRDEFNITAEDETKLQERAIQLGQPMTTDEIVRLFLEWRLSEAQGRQGGGEAYSPYDRYEVGNNVSFPSFEGAMGEVVGIRDGRNDRYDPFKVIEVQFNGMAESREFAAELNEGTFPALARQDRPDITLDELYEYYASLVREKVASALEASEDFMRFGNRWLPQLMLVDFHEGHCNIAEAMIDVTGEAMPASELLTEMPVEEDAGDTILQFSLNYALSRDERFANVGTDEEPRWYLPRLG